MSLMSYSTRAIGILQSRYSQDFKSNTDFIFVDGPTLTAINKLFRSRILVHDKYNLIQIVKAFSEHLFGSLKYEIEVTYSYKDLNLETLILKKNR